MNKYMLAAFLMVGVFGFQGALKAAEEMTAPAGQAVEVGNKVCPVSGEKIDSASGMESATVEHNGKIYNLCCTMCAGDFKKDPEKFSKIAEDEVAKDKAASGS
jgi:YHS domain-containing protein